MSARERLLREVEKEIQEVTADFACFTTLCARNGKKKDEPEMKEVERTVRFLCVNKFQLPGTYKVRGVLICGHTVPQRLALESIKDVEPRMYTRRGSCVRMRMRVRVSRRAADGCCCRCYEV